jgi:2-polyprenyl-6-methoxyphenol hydroxylase-like FAD-dependent oxidoreductase
MASEQQRRALVVGGSVGGLFAAHLLRAIGWDILVFERTAHDLAGRGAGIGTSEALFGVLGRLGLTVDASDGIEQRSTICLDRRGQIVGEVSVQGVSAAWDTIYRPLKQAWPPSHYRGGMTLERVEQDDAGVTAIFGDGSRVQGDLLVGADGFYSTVRRHVAPQAEPQYAGYVCWRGVVESDDLSPELHDLLDHRSTFSLPPGELALGLHIPATGDARPHDHRHYVVWYRPADERALADLCTDASGHHHGISIPPPLIRPEIVAALKRQAADTLAPQVATLVERTAQPLLQAILDVESPRMVLGRVGLLGDAAFVARPHVVAGVTKAALDAQSLADALAAHPDDLTAALDRYERERWSFGSKLVARGRQLGDALIGTDSDARMDLVLREYGPPRI